MEMLLVVDVQTRVSTTLYHTRAGELIFTVNNYMLGIPGSYH
jgi:hypothetical protein